MENYRCPPEIKAAALNPEVLLFSHNAAFERAIWLYVLTPKYGWPACPPPERWRCTMAMAYAMALPGGLDDACRAVGITIRKDPAGYALMLQMCKPMTPWPVTWLDTPKHRHRLGLYCIADVEAEIRLCERLVPLTPTEQKTWALDQRINDRGIAVDAQLVEQALKIVSAAQKDLNARIYAATDGAVRSTNQGEAILKWLKGRIDAEKLESIDKETVHELLGGPLPAKVREVLELRRAGAKASAAKLDALLAGLMRDNRVRGLLQYCAASTGRWGGRRFQPHNLKRPTRSAQVVLQMVKCIARFGDYGLLETLYGDALEAIGDCMRSVLVAAAGCTLYAGDFSNIEGRVLAWLAGEESKLDVFRLNDQKKGPDPYIIAAGAIYHVDPATIDKEDPRRQVGKVAELALGFQGGKVAFQKMAAGYRVVVTDEEAEEIKVAWREKHPRIVAFWRALEAAAYAAVQEPGTRFWAGEHISFVVSGSFLTMRLPSGRRLFYPYPRLEPRKTPWGDIKDVVTYMGIDTRTGSPTKGKWARLSSYGGKFAENCLARGTEVLTNNGWKKIETVEISDLLWDGAAWVNHKGLIDKGVQPVGTLWGVTMTADHKVLTNAGWKAASQSTGSDRARVRLPDDQELRGFGRQEEPLERLLRVRGGDHGCWGRDDQETRAGQPELRLPTGRADRGETSDPRHDGAPSLLGVALDARSVSAPDASGVAQLRRPGHYSHHGVGDVSSILAGYGANLPAGFDAGTGRQFEGVFGGELPLGVLQRTSPQHAREPDGRHTEGKDVGCRGVGGEWDRGDDASVPPGQRLSNSEAFRSTGLHEQVFDLMDAGPRHRFTVRGEDGTVFVVHNCTQAVARDCMRDAMLRLDAAGYPIVLHVHDEIVAEVKEGFGSLAEFNAIMREPPKWTNPEAADDNVAWSLLPVAVGGFEAPRYRK